MNDNRKRILMVLATPGIGGAEIYALNVVRYINHEKFHVDFIVNSFTHGKSIEEECRSYGCEFYQLPAFKIFNYVGYRKAWRSFLRKHHYDIVHAHATNASSIFLRIAKKEGVKTIAHSHSAGYRGNWLEQGIKKCFAKGVGRVADYWFACSEAAAMRLYGKKFKLYSNYYTIPNAINTDVYAFNLGSRQKIRKQHDIEDNAFVCGHVGSFTTPKNHRFLIDIFEEILKSKPGAILLCCGQGETMQDIKDYSSNKGILGNIVFAGVVGNVNEYLMAMDVFVFPSIFEGFPISVLEAEATGLPIIMSDVITKEVDLTDLIHRCGINQPQTIWANTVLNSSVTDRTKYNLNISKSEYNVKTAIIRLEQLYSKLISE